MVVGPRGLVCQSRHARIAAQEIDTTSNAGRYGERPTSPTTRTPSPTPRAKPLRRLSRHGIIMHDRWVHTLVEEWRVKRSVRRLADAHWSQIRTNLTAAAEGSILLTGNSHAALMGTPQIAGRPPCINIAAGGLTARSCVARLARLDPPARAAAVVLFLGTNDIRRSRHPERATTRRRFEADVRRVLVTLQEWAEHVFVAAIPPLGPNAKNHDPAAIAPFSDRLARICAEGDYIFFDPFAAMRAPSGCLAISGIFTDGIHLADYPALTAEVDQFVGFALNSKRCPRSHLACPHE
ncbi:GDSL family lipase [Methylobacterium sp. GXF4]|nr:GDSL family lipase [Methylobacterium sp. GXF4]